MRFADRTAGKGVTDPSSRMAAMNEIGPVTPPDASIPQVILYGRQNCGLCEEAHDILTQLIAERAASGRVVPELVERDISTNDAWDRAYFATIPVVEVNGRQLELATSATRLRALLAVLDGPVPARS